MSALYPLDRGFPADEQRRGQLLNRVTGLAVLADRFTLFRLVVVVVTPEASWRIDVADVARIRPEADPHLGKDIALVDRHDGPRRPIHVRGRGAAARRR